MLYIIILDNGHYRAKRDGYRQGHFPLLPRIQRKISRFYLQMVLVPS